jgi:Transposase DDE domain/Domain of unknown function (DUF4372)
MNSGRTLFSQLVEYLPRYEFRKCVARYRGNHRARTFSCWDHLLCLAFAQLTGRRSLRDLVSCLGSDRDRLYHMGIRGRVTRSTLADANERRDWRVYGDFAALLIAEARRLYLDDDLGVGLDQTIYALDSTTIDLCMTLFPWARYKTTQHAVKLHTLLDVRGDIPTFIRISAAKLHDVNILDELVIEPGAFYVMDRGYMDFARLHRWTAGGAFFVTRARKNLRFTRIASAVADKAAGVQCDQTISLVWYYAAKGYPVPLRRVRYLDAERGKRLVFLTNNFTLPAKTIADLYRLRWRVELFFKWIKQHLRIQAFYGTSANAVHTQVWTAVTAYLLVAIVRKRLNLRPSLYTILQILSVRMFEKTPLLQALSSADRQTMEGYAHNQLLLFDF